MCKTTGGTDAASIIIAKIPNFVPDSKERQQAWLGLEQFTSRTHLCCGDAKAKSRVKSKEKRRIKDKDAVKKHKCARQCRDVDIRAQAWVNGAHCFNCGSAPCSEAKNGTTCDRKDVDIDVKELESLTPFASQLLAKLAARHNGRRPRKERQSRQSQVDYGHQHRPRQSHVAAPY